MLKLMNKPFKWIALSSGEFNQNAIILLEMGLLIVIGRKVNYMVLFFFLGQERNSMIPLAVDKKNAFAKVTNSRWMEHREYLFKT